MRGGTEGVGIYSIFKHRVQQDPCCLGGASDRFLDGHEDLIAADCLRAKDDINLGVVLPGIVGVIQFIAHGTLP